MIEITDFLARIEDIAKQEWYSKKDTVTVATRDAISQLLDERVFDQALQDTLRQFASSTREEFYAFLFDVMNKRYADGVESSSSYYALYQVVWSKISDLSTAIQPESNGVPISVVESDEMDNDFVSVEDADDAWSELVAVAWDAQDDMQADTYEVEEDEIEDEMDDDMGDDMSEETLVAMTGSPDYTRGGAEDDMEGLDPTPVTSSRRRAWWGRRWWRRVAPVQGSDALTKIQKRFEQATSIDALCVQWYANKTKIESAHYKPSYDVFWTFVEVLHTLRQQLEEPQLRMFDAECDTLITTLHKLKTHCCTNLENNSWKIRPYLQNNRVNLYREIRQLITLLSQARIRR